MLFADGLPYALRLDPYHLPQYPYGSTVPSVQPQQISFPLLQTGDCAAGSHGHGVKGTALHGEFFMSDSLKNDEMKALDHKSFSTFSNDMKVQSLSL